MALSDDTEAYAVYLNGHARARAVLQHEELELFEADMAKAKAAMEIAYLEQAVIGISQPRFDPEVGWTTTTEEIW